MNERHGQESLEHLPLLLLLVSANVCGAQVHSSDEPDQSLVTCGSQRIPQLLYMH